MARSLQSQAAPAAHIGRDNPEQRDDEYITTFTNQAAVTAYPAERRFVGFQARLKL